MGLGYSNLYNSVDLAKYIVNKCTKEKHYINNIRLQYIMCFIFYYIKDKYNDIAFQDYIDHTGQFPQVQEVYYHFGGFGANNIIAIYKDIENKIHIHKDDIDRIIEEKRDKEIWEISKEYRELSV